MEGEPFRLPWKSFHGFRCFPTCQHRWYSGKYEIYEHNIYIYMNPWLTSRRWRWRERERERGREYGKKTQMEG
jgi:hypothetical protein